MKKLFKFFTLFARINTQLNEKILSKINFFNIFIYGLTYAIASSITVGGLYLSTTISGYNKINLENLVDKNKCDCNCWDGFYRGIHSRGSNYKAFYFNYDINFLKILLLFMLSMYLLYNLVFKIVNLLAYEMAWLLKRCIKLRHLNFQHDKYHMTEEGFIKNSNHNEVELLSGFEDSNFRIPILKSYYMRLRLFILFALGVSIYSNYYGVWSFINYLNDRDNRMFNSQLFYLITELIPTYVYYKLLDRYTTIKLVDMNDANTKIIKLKYLFVYRPIELNFIWPLLFISLLHIFLAMPEGMLGGIFNKQHYDDLKTFQLGRYRAILFRDIGLMLTDFIGIFVCIFMLIRKFLQFKINSNSSFIKSLILSDFEVKFWIFITIALYFVYQKYCIF